MLVIIEKVIEIATESIWVYSQKKEKPPLLRAV